MKRRDLAPEYVPMNPKVHSAIAAFVLFALVLLVMVQILTSKGSTLGEVAMFITIGSFVICVLSAKTGVVVLILLCGYVDLLKRLLVVERFDFLDVASCLAAAPLAMLGLSVHIVLSWSLGRIRLTRLDFAMFALTALVLAATLVLGRIRGMGGAYLLQDMANSAAYIMIVPVVHIYYNTVPAQLRLIRTLCILFVPVALYGVYQLVNGISWFELRYLQSGFSMNEIRLDELVVRPFSTLNSTRSLSVVCAVLSVLSLAPYFVIKGGGGFRALMNPLKAALPLIFLVGCLCSLGRTGYATWAVALACLFFFRNGFRVAFFYGAGIAVFVTLVLASDYLLENKVLNQLSAKVAGKSDLQTMATQLGTLNARLAGYRNILTDTSKWTLFGNRSVAKQPADGGGNPMQNEYHRHDLLSDVILNYGIVPFVFGLALVFLVLRAMHRRHLRMKDPARRQMVLAGLSLLVGIGVTVVASHSALTTFPVNFFFWLVAGIVLTNMAAREPAASAAVELDPGGAEAGVAVPSYASGGRFPHLHLHHPAVPPRVALRPPAPAGGGHFSR